MTQNRFKVAAFFSILLAVIVTVSSCRKYAYNENDNYSHCYCVYMIGPGVEQYEDVRMHSTSNEKLARRECAIDIAAEKAKKYGSKNVECSIY